MIARSSENMEVVAGVMQNPLPSTIVVPSMHSSDKKFMDVGVEVDLPPPDQMNPLSTRSHCNLCRCHL